MSQQAAREAAARAFDANPCKDTADALNGACYGTEDWWTPEGHPIRNGFRCCALWVAHVRALEHGDRAHAKHYAGAKRHKELCVLTFGWPLPHARTWRAQTRLKKR